MGKIISVKRFEIHDGDGIRTTLFLKGCPLSCRWCHNPESISLGPILSLNTEKCINCGECAKICSCHSIDKSGHNFDRENCIACGKCVEPCPMDALLLYGKEITADEILPQLLEDKIFFESSGGGVTLSGGEPLLQAEFSAEILKKLKENGINTAVDTCGFAKKRDIDKVLPYTDTFLFDVKAMDENVHISCTGASNKVILENLKYIDGLNKAIEIRIPFVPGMNDGEIKPIAEFLSTLKNIKKIKVLPYHALAVSKYNSIGLEYGLKHIYPPTAQDVNKAVELLKSYNLNAVNGAEN